jgi:hypothetical protein
MRTRRLSHNISKSSVTSNRSAASEMESVDPAPFKQVAKMLWSLGSVESMKERRGDHRRGDLLVTAQKPKS